MEPFGPRAHFWLLASVLPPLANRGLGVFRRGLHTTNTAHHISSKESQYWAMVRTAKAPAKKTTVSKAQAKEPQEAQEAEIAPRTDEIAAPKAEAEEINDFASRADRCPVYPGDVSRLVVAPRRIDAAALVYDEGASSWDGGHSRDCESHIAVTTAGIVMDNAGQRSIAEHVAQLREANKRQRYGVPGCYSDTGTEAQGAMRFLEELVKRPDAEVMLGGRGRWHIGKDSTGSHHGFGAEEGYVSTKASLAWIVHDLMHSDSFYRCTDAAELVQSPHYGVTRETLRAVFCDDAFAADGDLVKALAEKLKTWSIYVTPPGMAAYNVDNPSRTEPGSHCPTTQFFPGQQFNGDQVGEGSILVCLEHDVSAARSAAALSGLPSDLVGEVAQFTDLLASPVKSLVVLAERNGFYTVPDRPEREQDSDGYELEGY